MLDLSSRKVYGALAEQCVGGDAKADKVENATSGHLAGLDSNGNLTDSGVSPTEDVTVEGNPVTFDSPFEQDAKSVVVSVKPIQDLHGYDHPWPAGGGKNKLPFFTETKSAKECTVTPLDNGRYNFTGTATDNIAIQYPVSVSLSGIYRFVADNYTLISNGNISLYYQPIGGGTLAALSPGQTIDLSTYEVTSIAFFCGNGVTVNFLNVGLMLVLESEADKSFAPYSNICPISGTNEVEIEVSDGESEPTTTTIPLPSTLYDADVDVTNGDGTDNGGFIEFDGSVDEEWNKESGYNLFTLLVSGLPTVSNWGYPIPNWLTNIGIIFAESTNSGAENHTISFNGSYLYVKSDIATVEDFKTWLANNPIQVFYSLATPTTISFTPADVELLEGMNVVSTNAEKVAVTYGRSLWQDIDELKTDTEGKLDKSDVADVEGDTASRPYSVNEFMLRSDGFYKVTQPIAQNASITASNTTKTTIGAVLTALLNS